MYDYYVNNNAQSNGDHEVHKDGCYWLKLASNTTKLGLHSGCYSAVLQAKITYRKANGCKHCSNVCHTS